MKPLPRASILVLALSVSATTLAAAQSTVVSGPRLATLLLPPPDPCVNTQIVFNPAPWPSQDLEVLGHPARLFAAGPSSNPGETPRRHDPSRRPLVLIVDGNGFGLGDYGDLSGYLAVKGFNVVVIDRPSQNGPDPADQALAAIGAAFDTLGMAADAPVAVIGHSVGGAIAIDTIVANNLARAGYDIRALVLLAPKVGNGTGVLLDSDAVPALLTVYGSQDNDVSGLSDDLTDGFAAYDRSGTESSTTCHQPFCEYQAQMHKTMVYIHGADHSGLINQDVGVASTENPWDPFNSYLSRTNQFCIAKAYTLAMLEWTLDANTQWTSMVHGSHVPASIQGVVTAAPDELGNPAGTPVRLALQVSPKKRSVIENFEDGTWSIASQTPDVVTDVRIDGELAGGDSNVRHATRLGVMSWPERDEWQLVGVEVPGSRRNVTGFTHVALRLGQLAAVDDPARANPANTTPSVMIGLFDGASSSWVWSHAHGAMPPPDQRPNGQHQSAMNTLKIPLTAFSNIDKSAIEAVYVAFPAGSQGTLLIDSVEWFKP